MLSSSAPSNQGTSSLTRQRRASMPSVPSTTIAARKSHSTVRTSPW